MKRLRFILIALVFITTFVFSAIFHPVQAIDPIPISTPEELSKIGNHEDYPLSGHYKLINDIDMASFNNWIPIGTYGNGFSGSFDGQGFTIRNLTVSHPALLYVGLFGEISSSGTVTNLQISTATIEGYNYVGILTGMNYGTITNIAVHGEINGLGMVGGLSGYNNGSVDQTYSISSITANSNFGGLIGYNLNTISNSYSASSITKLSTFIGGGLVGYNSDPNNIINSYYDTNVSGLSDTDKGIPLITSQMKSKESYATTWNFLDPWHIIEGETYPSLFPFSLTIEKDPSQPDPAPISPINFIATFDESIDKSSFNAEDVVLDGTAGAVQVEITEITPNDGTTFKLSVSGMTNAGTVSLSIPEAKVLDVLHNFNDAGTSNIVSYEPDTTPPTVSISSTTTSPTNSSSIPISIAFREDVIGFTVDDIQVTNGALENFSGSGKDYTADLIPSSDGTVTVNIPADVTEDAAGNGNTAASPFNIKYDVTPPGVTISSMFDLNPYNLSTLLVDVKFNEKVIGFSQDDLQFTSGSIWHVVPLSDGQRYHVIIDQMTDGLITIVVPEGAVTDAAGNRNQPSNQLSILYDSTPPTVTISTSAANPTNLSSIPISIDFSEEIVGFDLADIAVTNGSPYNLSGSGDSYTVDVTPVEEGSITIELQENIAVDLAGNPNIASALFEITYDQTNPSVSIEQAIHQADPTNKLPILFSVTFSKPIFMKSFTNDDFELQAPAGATIIGISEIEPNDGTTFEVQIDGLTEDGLVTLSMPAELVQDLAGNDNTASTSTDNSVLYDTQSPLIDKVDIEKFYEGNPPEQFTITFSEPMYNPEGDADPDDVTNPANYLLVEWGENVTFDTTSCKDGLQVDDKRIKISSVTYDEETFVSTLKLPYKLQVGSYRLFICGSATLYDAAMNPLNDGLDSIHSFIVLPEPEEEEENTNSSQSPTLLPETGFPIGQTTQLAKQHAIHNYTGTELKLEIPIAGMNTSIVGVPLIDGDWEVSWLGIHVGYLYGSAFPTWQGNTVLTGHVWNANNTPGIFFNLKTLKYGDLIRIHAYGLVYTYAVRENRLIAETNLKTAFQSEEYDWLTLLTCEGYQPGDKTYAARRMVRAVLVSVE